ncbi:MAG: hypothetical protein L3J33_01755 [Rhodobacteraceae bacterium]|nr:hypothetical protein [Paracoccaceae bacterium]
MEVYLHLGAHKTATTFIQQSMQSNAETLAKSGIFAPKLEDIRAAITPGMAGKPMLGFEECISLILPESGVFHGVMPERLILSDENIIGYPAEIFAKGVFYLDAKQRLKVLKSWLPVAPTKIVFAVRPYTTFFSSAYAQWLGPFAKKHGPKKRFIPREVIHEKIAGLKRGWPAIMRDLQKVFPDSQIIVKEYSAAPEYLQEMFEILLGDSAGELKYNAGYFWNRGLSADLVSELESQLAKGEASPESVAKIRAQRSKNPSDLGAHFWPDDQRAALLQRYETDIRTLKGMTNNKLIWAG